MIGIIFAICCVLIIYSIYLESKITALEKSIQYLFKEVDEIINKYNELITNVNNMSDIILEKINEKR